MIGVVIVAPGLAVRAGLRALLSAAGQEAVAEAGGGIEVLDEAAGLDDLDTFPAEMDVCLLVAGSASPTELNRSLRQALREPSLRGEARPALLLLTNDPQEAQGLASLPLRAWGILSFDAPGEELAAAVRALYLGLWVGDPVLLAPTLQRLSWGEEPRAALIETLTERESEVIQLLARGLANKQIAAELKISEHTVKFHVSSIYTKLGATNRTEAVRLGIQRGLVVL